MSECKGSPEGCFGMPGDQGPAIAAFNPFDCLEISVVKTEILFLSQSGIGRSNTSIYHECLPALME